VSVSLLTNTGNNYGIGETRKLELKGSCASLGIDPKRCIALDRPDIQDNPKVWWDEKVIEDIVKEYVGKWQADAVSFSLSPRTGPRISIDICRFPDPDL
jgi:N-acetylglucosaminylphosphatidylinositol deacetylase